jgi:hypothetical protein
MGELQDRVALDQRCGTEGPLSRARHQALARAVPCRSYAQRAVRRPGPHILLRLSRSRSSPALPLIVLSRRPTPALGDARLPA